MLFLDALYLITVSRPMPVVLTFKSSVSTFGCLHTIGSKVYAASYV